MNRDNKIVLIIFFPITAYLFIGTFLFFLISLFDKIAEFLGNYSEFPGVEDYSSSEWHETSIWLTSFFPITYPVILVWISVVLIYSLAAAFLRFLYEVLKAIWEFVADLVARIWDWAVEAVKAIWEWTVASIEDIWEVVTSIFN